MGGGEADQDHDEHAGLHGQVDQRRGMGLPVDGRTPMARASPPAARTPTTHRRPMASRYMVKITEILSRIIAPTSGANADAADA